MLTNFESSLTLYDYIYIHERFYSHETDEKLVPTLYANHTYRNLILININSLNSYKNTKDFVMKNCPIKKTLL